MVSSKTFTRQQFHPLLPHLYLGNVSHSLLSEGYWGCILRESEACTQVKVTN